MPSIVTSPFRLAARLVSHQVRRLHAVLEGLAAQVRAAIARAVGQATGEAVREALGVILDGSRAPHVTSHLRSGKDCGVSPAALTGQASPTTPTAKRKNSKRFRPTATPIRKKNCPLKKPRKRSE